MQSIGHRAHHGEYGQGGTSGEASGGLVLPRVLRKPVRQFRRLLNGGFRISRRGFVTSAVILGVLATGGGFFLRDGGEAVMASVAPSLGIAIKSFEISGNREVSEMEIASLVAPGQGISILGFDVDAARKALKEHAWIADATVSRVYPDKLVIEVTERQPFALWQNEFGLQMIDSEGRVLAEYDGRANTLPLLVGKGAESSASEFVALMNRFPSIASMAKAYIMVGERRWDVELNNGITVMLPEKNADTELGRLEQLAGEKELLARDIARIDMRIADRMTIQVSAEARELIDEKRKEQLKLLATSAKERNT